MATFGSGLRGRLVVVDIPTNNTVGIDTLFYTCPTKRSTIILFVSYEGGASSNVKAKKRESATAGEQVVVTNIITGGGKIDRLSPTTIDPNIATADLDKRILKPQDTLTYSLNDAGPSPRLIAYLFEFF